MSETNKEKLSTLGIRVNQYTLERFNQLKDDGAFDTSGQFLETLLERYSNPMKINEDNKKKVAELSQNLIEMEAKIKQAFEDTEAKDREIARLEGQIASQSNDNSDLSTKLEEMKAVMRKNDGCIAVPVTQLDRMCLDYLAQRENTARKRNDITPEVFFIYVLREMLIKGNKFSIPCVPDSKIAEFERRIKND